MNMKKIFLSLILVVAFLFTTSAYGQGRNYFSIEFVNEWGVPITSATQVDIQNESGTAVAVYTTKSGSTEVGSTGVITTGIDDGKISFWYAATAADVTVTDGTYTREIESFSIRDTRFMFPTFLTAMASLTVGSSQILDFTYGGVVFSNASLKTLDIVFDDDASTINIGDGTDDADVKIFLGATTKYVQFDESSGEVDLVDIDLHIDTDSHAYFGDSKEVDMIYTTGLFSLLYTGGVVAFGADDDAPDVIFYSEATNSDATFDEDASELFLDNYDIQFDDDALLIFGTNDDFTVYSDTANILEFDPGTAGAGIYLGTAYDDAVDVTWFGDLTGDTVLFDEENCEVYFADIDIQLADDADLIIGTDDDWVIESDQDGILEIIPDAQGNEIRLGASNATSVVVTWYGDISGNTVVFDEENQMVEFEDVNIALGDSTKILYGDTIGTGVFSVAAVSNVLTYLQVASDTGSITYGLSGTDIPITWYGETAGADFILTGDTVLLDGMDMTFEDDDILNFGDDSNATINWDEDGNDLLQVTGPVEFQTTLCRFRSNPVVCKNDGAAAGGAASEVDWMAVDGINFEYFLVTGGTQAIKVPFIDVNGLNVRLDQTNDEGLEMTEGITSRSKSAFTIGTDAFYLKAVLTSEDPNQLDICAIGFRLAAAYNQDMYAHNTYAGINVNNAVVNGIFEMNAADANETDCGETWAAGETHTLEVRISAAKAVTRFFDGAAVSTPLATTWTDTDTVIPFLHLLGDAAASSDISIKRWECGLQ